MAHAPSRHLGDASLALNFLGGNAVARGAEQKMILNQSRSGARVRWNCVSAAEYLVATTMVGGGTALCDGVELRLANAFIAIVHQRIASFHKMLKASLLRGEAVLTLVERRCFGFDISFVQPRKLLGARGNCLKEYGIE